jgi:PKD repeat protein
VPVVDFAADDTTPAVDQVVALDYIGTGAPTSYSLNWGDGTTNAMLSHAYAAEGTYSVTMTATNAFGSSAPLTKTGYITVSGVLAGLQDGGFATPALSAGTFAYNPTGSAWDFGLSGGVGIVTSGATVFDAPAPRDGAQVAFLQTISAESFIRQSVTVAAGDYTAGLMAVARVQSGVPNSQTVEIRVDGVAVGNVTVNSGTWVGLAAQVSLTAGSHAIDCVGTNTGGGNNTAFIDEVYLVPAAIVTPFEFIPDFGAPQYVTKVAATGNWFTAGTWTPSGVPAAGAVVSIPSGVTVTYNGSSSAAIKTISVEAGGSLVWRTDIDTSLVVVNLLVKEGGYMECGTASAPVAASKLAEFVFADSAIDTDLDPRQYGNGLIVLGKLVMHGAAKTPFLNTATEPLAGHTAFMLSAIPTGWRAGDKLFHPDSRQPSDDLLIANWEYPVLASNVTSTTANLTAALAHDHKGARDGDGVLDHWPDVLNLTRNILMRSANPTGTRGHSFFTYRADTDVRHVEFRDMGRTTNDGLDSFAGDGGYVRHVGANQVGRYSAHLHHVETPGTPHASGYTFVVKGCSFHRTVNAATEHWAATIHDTDLGLFQDNVGVDWHGAVFVTEDGSESENLIDHNYAAVFRGQGGRPVDAAEIAVGGVGFYLAGTNNYVTNNVAANGVQATVTDYIYAYLIFSGSGAGVINTVPIRQFEGNFVYGCDGGLSIWHVGAHGTNSILDMPESTVKDYHAWHVRTGVFSYPLRNFTFDGCVGRGDFSYFANPVSCDWYLSVDYMTPLVRFRNCDIQGFRSGIGIELKFGDPSDTAGDTAGGSTFTVEDTCYLRCYTAFFTTTPRAATGGSDHLVSRYCHFGGRIDFPSITDSVGTPHSIIVLAWLDPSVWGSDSHMNWLVYDEFIFENLIVNGGAPEHFRVYWQQSAPGYVTPQTNGTNVGSPEAGQTNSYNWTTYGLSVGGIVSPTSTTRADVNGGYVEAL